MVTKDLKKQTKRIIKPAKKKKLTVVRETYKIDATAKILGRLASEISILLRGKNKPTFQHHIEGGNNIIVINAAKIKTSGKKLNQKVYYHYSGYPGGLKIKKMNEVFSKNPSEVLKRAVWNMLPKNKLRAKMIKRLKITN
ncbi:MAG: 50S ribosomal protein L13 [Patescibacteria group bacterium]|jgi:large subunit ribosomal protein L13